MLSRILSNLPRWLLAPALTIMLTACGGGGGGTLAGGGTMACTASTCGSALLTLTDATGDFTSYTADVTSLKLTKADGTVVETLPTKTRVDFAQLVNVTEFLTAASIPLGDYVSATMTVDYSSAAVYVDVGGSPVQATLVDSSGHALATLTLTVQLDNQHHLMVAPGAPARLALDFNLAASNTVDLTNPAAPVVTVQPFIVASVVPADGKELRARGTLVSVDATADTYTVDLRPFDDQDGDRGQLVVHTTSATAFEVDGTAASGAAGIAAMQALTAGALTVAFGALSEPDHTFTATRVLAGSSVDMPSLDALFGTVISRNGNTVVVRGATVHSHTDHEDRFSAEDVTLTIGTGTVFHAAGDPAATPTGAWASIGSNITAFGTAGTDAGGHPTFDATAGRVRIEFTSLWGFQAAVSPTPGQVTLNLQSLAGRAPDVFNFAGTGQTSAQDSNPATYVVTTGVLPLTGIDPAAPLRFFGFVQPFGSAPPDFNARTLVDFSAESAGLEVGFGDGSTTALSTVNSSELVINLADPLLGVVHVIRIGPQLIDLTKLGASPPLVSDATGPDEFAIGTEMSGTPDTIDTFSVYTDFATALSARLTGTTKVLRVLATGHYDQVSNTFTARRIVILLR